MYGETYWKVVVFYDVLTDEFALSINDIPFSLLPHQAKVSPQDLGHLMVGTIKLNQVVALDKHATDVIDGWQAE